MSAFEMISGYPDGYQVQLTADGKPALKGRIGKQPDRSKVVVFVTWDSWFEFTAQSDIEVKAPGAIHVNG